MTTSEGMRVSVVIPSKDRFELLLKALQGLAKSSFLPHEVIVVDDASVQEIEEDLNAYTFPFEIKFFRDLISKGAAVSRNSGILNASGDIVVGHDDDVVPEPDMIAWHVYLHEKHPEEAYGIMGRFVFDPERTRSALELFLENEGPFAHCARGEDGALCDKGVITGNYSFKRSFAEGRRLFNETFPFNRNEDTEWSLRWIRDGWMPRYHRAPSGLHYSYLTAKRYLEQAYQGGICKGVWALQSPDDTDVVNGLYGLLRYRNRELFVPEIEATCSYLDSADPDLLVGGARNLLFDAYSKSIQYAIKIGIIDSWEEDVEGFKEIASCLSKFTVEPTIARREAFLSSAVQVNPGFLPTSLCYLDFLLENESLSSAEQFVLSCPFDSIWFLLRKCRVESIKGHWSACVETLSQIYMRTQNFLNISRVQRQAVVSLVSNLRCRERDGLLVLPEPLRVEIEKECGQRDYQDLCSTVFKRVDKLGLSDPNPSGESYLPFPPLGVSQDGRLVWISPDCGFGFIESNSSRITHFVDSSELASFAEGVSHFENSFCTFDSVVSSRGYEARNVEFHNNRVDS